MSERVLYYYERVDKKLELALNFIEELKRTAERQQKRGFADRCEKVLEEIKAI